MDETSTKTTLLRRLMMFLCVVYAVSLVYSIFLVTVSMMGLVVLGFAYLYQENKSVSAFWKHYLSSKDFLMPILLFIMILFSGINSADMGEWIHQLKLKLPFLFIPVAFLALPKLTKKEYQQLVMVFILTILVSSIWVLKNYILDFETFQKMIGEGQSLTTPINHIKYSLFASFAAISSFILYYQKASFKYINRNLILAVGIYLVVFLHVLAVRSGIAVFYLASFFLFVIFILRSKAYWKGLIALILMALGPIAAYHTVPSFQMKIHYMTYDLERFREGGGDNYSDSQRIRSYITGWSIFKDYPVLGTGIGDLYEICKERIKSTYGEKSKTLYPHNEFLFILAGTGILGLLLFLTGFFYPLVYQRNYEEPFLLCLHIIIFFSFLVENTLERAISIGFFVFFLSIGLSYLKGKKNEPPELQSSE